MDDFLNSAINDLRREREIFVNESLKEKQSFANEIKDTLGEQILEQLTKKEKIVEPNIKKKSKFEMFLDKLAVLCNGQTKY